VWCVVVMCEGGCEWRGVVLVFESEFMSIFEWERSEDLPTVVFGRVLRCFCRL
jgi:hypothetical protein